MIDIAIVFPDQLFAAHPCFAKDRPIYLIEEYLFYKVQPCHRQRLVLLRAAMRNYAEDLSRKGYKVNYLSSSLLNARGAFCELLNRHPIETIHVAEFADEWLFQDLTRGAKQFGWKIQWHPSPAFLCSNSELKTLFSGKSHFSMAAFYAGQRKRSGVLMEDGAPLGGKYSFDAANRKRLPKGCAVPSPFVSTIDRTIKAAIAEVEKEFPEAIGEAVPFLYPATHSEARHALQDFLNHKLALFGDYQDAMQQEDSILFHSVLSPLLNIGLLTPKQVIEAALRHAQYHPIPLNSLEGFLRQIMGWREFMRASYLLKGSCQRSCNFFQHREKIPGKFWEGKVGILPLDTIIQRILRTGYCNHIERLMVLGNFLLLTETAPSEIYRWFMACFADAYDWVMVPNVYGMSQFADGGTIVTKPYVSSSNYILKMSNYSKGGWTEIWDGLFWRFLHKHRSVFSANYRSVNLVKMLDKNEWNLRPKIQKANAWLEEYRALPAY